MTRPTWLHLPRLWVVLVSEMPMAVAGGTMGWCRGTPNHLNTASMQVNPFPPPEVQFLNCHSYRYLLSHM